MMKSLKKLFSLCLVPALCLSLGTAALAAPVSEATIDISRTGSLDIYKYDFTNAAKDGVWDSSYVSTGVYDQSVNDALGNAIRAGDTDNTSDLGNGETSYGYAIKGVEFTYLRVADICQFTESTADGAASSHVEVLYGIDKATGSALLAAIGLADGAGRYENAGNSDKLDSSNYYYQPDVLIDALRASLEANATTVKNALENYVRANGGTALPLTDSYGHTSADGLPLGLYLVVETKVPEMVIDTTAPFFVSLPMTSVDGSNATDGGTRWMYDVTLYPKNLTGIPTLEKTLRENQNDTGKNNGSNDIADGYAHTGTASDGDVIDYQLISTLPSITSESTYLTCYTFVDTLSKGLSYNKNDVVLEFFTDAACTDKIASWNEATEVRTDNGYTLLKDDIEVVISQTEVTEFCDIYASDVLGLIQNDPRYATIINDTGDLHNMPQRHLEHHLLTASATVDGNAVTMLTDNGSLNAEAPLRVVNTRGFDLPKTGDNGTWWLTICGTLLILCAGGFAMTLVMSKRKKNTRR